MKFGPLLAGSLSALLMASCGGEPQATTPATTPATAKPTTPPAEAAAKPAGQQQQKPTKRRVRRPRINVTMVKTLFGNDPAAPKAEVAATPELVALGEALYHSEQMSPGGDASCASCHDLSNYGMDGAATSPGSASDVARNTPTTYNAARHFRQFWDGRAAAVEELVKDPIGHGVGAAADLVGRLKGQGALAPLFGQAFAGQDAPVTADNVAAALGAFARTLTTKSKWDDYLDGNMKAMSNEELVGLKTFMDVGCTQCHMTRLLGGHTYQKLGVLKPYTGKDTGRMQVTGQETDKYLFKVPSLVNTEKTAPYYHDGSMATLEDAIKDMADNQLNKKLKPEQVEAIATFLKATTGALPEQFAKD